MAAATACHFGEAIQLKAIVSGVTAFQFVVIVAIAVLRHLSSKGFSFVGNSVACFVGLL